MKKDSLLVFIITLFVFLFVGLTVKAQITEDIYQTDYHISPEDKGKLLIAVDNVSFFKNNEYNGKFLKGYSLPGLWLKPMVTYYPLKNIKLEAGAYGIRFWGADKYPSFAYSDIATWKGDQFQHSLHIVPVFRAQFAFTPNFYVVIGNIYGAANHRLIDPLYNPELNLIADPESGVQVIYTSKYFDLDTWLNWESFIFEMDNHQEAFTVGVSSRFKFNDDKSKFHIYTPFQVVGQHRGGEIDNCPDIVQMLFNGATGLETVWNVNNGVFRKMEMGVNVAGYYQQKGCMTSFEKGYGFHAHASVDIASFKIKTSYWMSEDFATLFGSPFYGNISMAEEGAFFDKTKMVYLGAEYFKKFGKGYAMGIDLDLYRHFPTNINTLENGSYRRKAATSFSFGVYFRVNPSFLIKKF